MSQIFSNAAISRTFLLLIIGLGIYFFYGFLVPVLAALIICFASWPLYQRLLNRCHGKKVIAASLAVSAIILGLVIPLTLVFSYAIDEIQAWMSWLTYANQHGAAVPMWIEALPLAGIWLAKQWTLYLGEPQALGHIISVVTGDHITGISRWLLMFGWDTVGFMLTLLFMLITLFFLYKDGDLVASQLDTIGERMLPTRWQRFSRVVPATVSSTVIGMTLIAIGEGVVLGIAYWIAGVPSPIAFGVLTAFMALIPGGAPLAFTLLSLYLVGTGDFTAGAGLFAWGGN